MGWAKSDRPIRGGVTYKVEIAEGVVVTGYITPESIAFEARDDPEGLLTELMRSYKVHTLKP
jgi:hypothetical protein